MFNNGDQLILIDDGERAGYEPMGFYINHFYGVIRVYDWYVKGRNSIEAQRFVQV